MLWLYLSSDQVIYRENSSIILVKLENDGSIVFTHVLQHLFVYKILTQKLKYIFL